MEKEELIKKYSIDIEKLKKEQEKLAKSLEIKDKIDFSLVEKYGAVYSIFIKNKMLCGIIVCNKDFEITEQDYVLEKVKFPYIAEFRAYRELPAMMEVLNKINEKPDIIFVQALGITHPRLGLASHFSLASGIPVIGISDAIIGSEIKDDNVLRNNKKVGKVFVSKPGARPIYVSPGNQISIETSLKITSQLIKLPHKYPEPIYLVHKYLSSIENEVIDKENQ